MSGVNPQGCHVTSFKQPSSEELDHDYLWRYLRYTPERGRIGIFNRSYYEEVLVVQVQKRRFLARLVEPERNWKFSASDVRERGYRGEHQEAYEDAIRYTASTHAPWYVVPADNKWFTRVVVAAAVADTMRQRKLHYPVVDAAKRKELAEVRTQLAKA